MLAYHNDAKIKKAVVAEMAAHQKADSLVQGYGYWKDGKGCAVGCLIKSDNHKEYETRFGIPEQLALLEDSIFEGLPKELAQKWPERFLESINTGADLSRVWSEFAYWMLTDSEHGQIKYANGDKFVIDAIMGMAKLHKEVVEKKIRPRSAAESAAESAAWSAARSAARSAAWSAPSSAARSAAWSAGWSAAWSAPGSAEASAAWAASRSAAESAAWAASRSTAWSASRSAAESAAESAAWSAAWSAASSAEYIRMADKLIGILKECV